MAERIDDDLLDLIAVCAPIDQVAARLEERYRGFAGRVSPFSLAIVEPEVWAAILAG